MIEDGECDWSQQNPTKEKISDAKDVREKTHGVRRINRRRVCQVRACVRARGVHRVCACGRSQSAPRARGQTFTQTHAELRKSKKLSETAEFEERRVPEKPSLWTEYSSPKTTLFRDRRIRR